MSEELDRREMLEAALEQAEEGTLEAPIEKEIEVNDDPIQAENASNEEETSIEESNNRDEKGRFKSKTEETSSTDDPVEEPELVDEVSDANEEKVEYTLQKPTTFKKDYVPIWEKMAAGKPLTKEESVKFAEYTGNIRESEFKRGVSTYKAEADNARQLTDAINPFVPELQAQGIHPVAWINNLGRAHMILSKAPYDQKVQMFHRLANEYGIQLDQNAIQMPEQAYVDPYQQQLMQQLQATQQQVQQLSAIRQQEENARLNDEINRVSSNKERFPHFEMVREDMAQLLERGLAQDLETAYAKAVRMNDEAYKLEQDKLLRSANTQASKAQQVAKAKATAVSPKSVTPSGQVSKGDAKDRRSLLLASLADVEGGRV